ncbi:MAG TPA: type II toxin-antitoxin system VapC family toxin [Steroidobacteraceae bacterium]|nr:type II toxin-antitoxin system VapC family toxin [Steroidobacteraceae bacterium]
MRLLIDSHTLIWWYVHDQRLSQAARAALLDQGNEILVSPVCAWEIATKHRLGKWPEAMALIADFSALLDADGFRRLPVNETHALRAGRYVVPHGDPFDRMLAAQCELEDLTLVTRDPAFGEFGCRTLW